MKLTLHIGTQKTGSSALQSFLALNSDLLAEYDILYPKHPSFSSARKGEVTSGNLPSEVNGWIDYIGKLPKGRSEHILFSNEVLFNYIFSSHENFVSLHKKYDLTLIMYVRNPLDHLFSSYGQHVKRHGETKKISSWLHNSQYIDKVAQVIKSCKDNEINLHIINYSKKKDAIEKSFCNVLLGEKSDKFLQSAQFAQKKTINRSLARVEYEIQREFNKHIGAESFKFISDFLVNNLPDVKAEKEYIEEDVLVRFIEKHKEKVAYINTFLDKGEELELDIPKDIKPQAGKFEISSKQIAVLADSISQQIIKSNAPTLVDSDADFLRDIALKFENQSSLTLEDAHYLMKLAHKTRPTGPVINEKYNKYRAALSVSDKSEYQNLQEKNNLSVASLNNQADLNSQLELLRSKFNSMHKALCYSGAFKVRDIGDYAAQLSPVEFIDKSASETLIVFGGMASKPSMPPKEFFATLSGKNLNIIFVKDFQQCWYQNGLMGLSDDIETTVEYLKSLIPRQTEKLTCLGTSAGGYASIRFGVSLKADRILSFSPQTKIDNAIFNRFKSLDSRMKEVSFSNTADFDLSLFLSNEDYIGKIELFYGEYNKSDRDAAQNVAKFVTLCPCPTNDHNIASFMKSNGDLDLILESI